MFSQYTQERQLQYFFSSPVFVALFHNGVEISSVGTGYVRQTYGLVNYSLTVPITASNADAITFPAPVDLDWEDVNGIALYDSDTDGNLLVPVQTISTVSVPIGTPFVISSAALRIRI